MSRPKAAPARFPYTDHRTIARIDAASQSSADNLARLEALSKERALTDAESRQLELLIRRVA